MLGSQGTCQGGKERTCGLSAPVGTGTPAVREEARDTR